jgi:hypothetical protein
MSVYQKLQAARIKLQTTELKKSGHNKFAGYQYFELGDFLPTIQKIFHELQLCGMVSFTADLATLRIVDTEDSTEVSFTSPMGSAALKGCHEVQNIGAVETYQRRYLWVTAMEIVEHDALDATTAKEAPKAAKGTITATQGAMDALDAETRQKAEKLAAFINSEHAAGNDWSAFEAWETTDLDNDAKVAVWSKLGSKVRSTIKSMKAKAEDAATTQ